MNGDQNELSKGDLVVTSRSRYGTIVDTESEAGNRICKVRIGRAVHKIARDQLNRVADCVPFKVHYGVIVAGKHHKDTVIINVPKGTAICTDSNDVFREYMKNEVECMINCINVHILNIELP